MTEFELKNIVASFYNGYLTLDKAIKLYEIEYGCSPDLEETVVDEVAFPVNSRVFSKYNLPDCVNEESMRFMKQLQESGAVNMFGSATYVQQHLMVNSSDAVTIVSAYMKYYEELYCSHNLV